MGDRFIHDLASSCGSHSNKGTRYGSRPYQPSNRYGSRPYQPSNRYGSRPYQPSSCRTSALCHNTTMDHVLPELWSSGVISDAPLSPSHAGDKGDSAQENTGLRPVDAVVLPRPSSPRKGREEGKASVSVPSKENTNTTTVNSIQIANASIANASEEVEML